jgi:hypothetical protein
VCEQGQGGGGLCLNNTSFPLRFSDLPTALQSTVPCKIFKNRSHLFQTQKDS